MKNFELIRLIKWKSFGMSIFFLIIINCVITQNIMAKSDSTVIIREIIPIDSSIYKSMSKIVNTTKRPHSGCYSKLFALLVDSISDEGFNLTNGHYKNHTLIKYKIKHDEVLKGVVYPLFPSEIYPDIVDHTLGYFNVDDCSIIVYSEKLTINKIKSYFSLGTKQQEFIIFNPLKRYYKYSDCEWVLYFYKCRLYNLYNDYIYDKIEEDENFPLLY